VSIFDPLPQGYLSTALPAERRPSVKQASGKLPPVKQGAGKRPSVSLKNNEGAHRGASDSQGFDKRPKPSKFSEIKQSRSKSKAGRQFSKQFADDAPSSASAGPRPAVYKTEMGRQHKKMTQMQSKSYAGESSVGLLAAPFQWLKSPKFVVGLMGIVICVVLVGAFLYPVAKQSYTAARQLDQKNAELVAVQANNQAIQNQIDTLSTPEGIEDRARSDYGWTMQGEQGGTVYGLDSSDSSSTTPPATADAVADGVQAPQYWYTGFLDALFGVK